MIKRFWNAGRRIDEILRKFAVTQQHFNFLLPIRQITEQFFLLLAPR